MFNYKSQENLMKKVLDLEVDMILKDIIDRIKCR
jgi:hypothetical protein